MSARVFNSLEKILYTLIPLLQLTDVLVRGASWRSGTITCRTVSGRSTGRRDSETTSPSPLTMRFGPEMYSPRAPCAGLLQVVRQRVSL
jgi:hypothetical protein